MPVNVKVNSPKVTYGGDFIKAKYNYESSTATQHPDGRITINPYTLEMDVTTAAKVPRTGLMMAGWGGNNGTTFTGMCLANKHKLTWHSKRGEHKADFLGSVSMIGTFPVGLNEDGEEVFAPVRHMLPMLDPTKMEIDGWDISSMNLYDGLKRAAVFDWELQEKLRPHMEQLKPRKAVFFQDFVAANQADRVDNVITGTKYEQMEKLRADIRDFKTKKNLDKIIILWVGNTERFSEVVPGLNDTWANLEKSMKASAHEVSPSTVYAAAAILEGCAYINGSPQNTFVPGILELAEKRRIMICGDDLKTGQTKLKSVLMDYLVGAGLKPESIVSYNHLGNNDGKNLSAPQTFRSKEISKRGVVDDMVASNKELFAAGTGPQKPDHLVVIKYVPYVGDSKRAMDEYTSAIAMGGLNTMVIHNTCEDSLLAAPIMLDLVLFMELFQRMDVKVNDEKIHFEMGQLLGYWMKAPLHTMTNSLFRQRSCIENLVRAALSLPANNHLFLTKSPITNVVETLQNGVTNGVHKAVREPSVLKNGNILRNILPSTNGVHSIN
ncbi:Inositol-3-phosphate synthase 1 [Orchesella cincta]|uniref:inositol-3-phosphate synthase n=1 Tax=Orchesella cincta TaxID=48709 RepID=A0A1D2NLB0_ORCCI|nr:Inositol-3-phosphate synthase 1 [Orchesella cincta]